MNNNDLPDIASLPAGNEIYLFCGYTDLRMSIDGLAYKMRYEYGINTAGKTMMFCGRKPDRIKILYKTETGYALLYHRYEEMKLKWPRASEEIWMISSAQMFKLLNGYPIRREEVLSVISPLGT